MIKKSAFQSVVIFLICLAIDFVLKLKHVRGSDTHFNYGFIFGSLQDLPASLTLVTLTSFGGLLIFIYLLIIVILSDDLKSLKLGMGFLFGGVLGNVIDRALHGGTLDFLKLSFKGSQLIYYNPADAFQWLGALVIVINIFKNDHKIWYPANQRSFGLINPKEQIRLALKFTAISFSTCLVLGIFSISYLTLYLHSINSNSNSTVIGFAISYFAISLGFMCLSFISGLILSQKSAGPLFAFEKYVESLLKGESKNFKLREGDNYKHLEEIAENLKKHLEK